MGLRLNSVPSQSSPIFSLSSGMLRFPDFPEGAVTTLSLPWGTTGEHVHRALEYRGLNFSKLSSDFMFMQDQWILSRLK